MSRPRLVMLDEPSLGLAPVVVRQVFGIIRRLREEGLTILLVEQSLKQALEVADRGYVVETGRIAMEGPAGELLDDPAIRSSYLGV
jgi:branched-chain amino acid transport system ATP-binding protein